MIQVTKQGIARTIPQDQLEQYLAAGWSQPAVKAKKKSEKTAETAPEAAREDQGNANQGE